jgi:hypothetical protein
MKIKREAQVGPLETVYPKPMPNHVNFWKPLNLPNLGKFQNSKIINEYNGVQVPTILVPFFYLSIL